MSKHTPGPWKFHCDPGPEIDYAWVSFGKHEGRITELDRRSDGHGPYRDRTVHDARLIAAAPLGFELASEIVRACDKGTGRQMTDETRREIEPIRKLAVEFLQAVNGQAAISAAQGN